MPTRWGSLSLRLTLVSVSVLVAAAFAVGYLFDRGRAEAVARRELEHLRLHAERGADEVARIVGQMQADVLFLSRTPPIQGIRRAIEGEGTDAFDRSVFGQWKERLQQIFLSFAEARPEYFQVRLIGSRDAGLELVRVERTSEGLQVTPPEALQRKGQRYYFQEAARLTSGSVYLSRIDLNEEHSQLSVPHLPTLRAATPVYDPNGSLFGIVVLNLDMGRAFARAQAVSDRYESMYIASESGDLLLHPEPGRAFAFELGTPFRLEDAFPSHADRILGTLSGGGGFVDLPEVSDSLVAYVTARPLDPGDPNRHLVYILTEPLEPALQGGGLFRLESLLGMGALLALAIALIAYMVRRLTASLSALVNASKAIAKGNYQIALPAPDDSEVGSLVVAFQRMAGEVERRVQALAELNRDLERHVEERTKELARQYALQQLILDNIADGVVVADRGGHFLLWNRKAAQIIGSGPDEVPPERWAEHFGVLRDDRGDPVPIDELPLLRAIRGEPSDNVELYLCNPNSGAGRWAQVTARPLLNADGDVTGGVAVLVDVTENKRLRSSAESHRADLAKVQELALRAEIAASAAHQLSQPIAAMSNYAGAAVRMHEQGRLGGDELRDLLGRIELLAKQAGEALDALRGLIRHAHLPEVPVDVNQVVDFCLDFLSARVQRQAVRVERRFGHDLPKPIGEPVELSHALIQLLSNGLEAMESTLVAERRLCVATSHDPATDRILIDVGDTGRGVSPELADRLFEPWQTDKPGALGIGLSIAQTMVEKRKGVIRMFPGDNGGAVFRIELPVSGGGQT